MKILLTFFILLTFNSFAKKDFYYGFIDTDTQQISEIRKQRIVDGFELINSIKKLARDGKIKDAYFQIESFREKNDLSILDSDISILYSELALKMNSKRVYLEASEKLELDIKQSKINEYDIAKAYSTLVELKLKVNKTEDAKYYANNLVRNFEDELSQAYGKINIAKIYRYQKLYDRAIVTLYKVLTETKDKLVATIIADELFELYILNDQKDKAKELIKQVLENNMDYYANDSYIANRKIERLLNANFPDYAIKILKELLNRTKKEDSIQSFKFKLADIYMSMYDKTNYYLEKAKEIYEEIINDFPNGKFAKESKMYIDEILMRQGVLNPNVLTTKYPDSESINYKALLQELLNQKKDKQYDRILKTKKIYKKIPNTIAKRFGYSSMNEIFDSVNIDFIKYYLVTNRCIEITDTLKTARKETLILLSKDQMVKDMFFDCMIQTPSRKAYFIVKNAFVDSRDANLYLNLEKMALSLKYYDEALEFSNKLFMTGNKELINKEFLVKYEVLKYMNNPIELKRLFLNVDEKTIDYNKNNPMIMDFYNDYYLYLKSNKEIQKANKYLVKLDAKQREIKAFIYSPFVEQELANMYKEEKQYDLAQKYLLESLENARRVKPKDEIKVYYDLVKLFELQNNSVKMKEYIDKCNNVNGADDNLYKKMCSEMK